MSQDSLEKSSGEKFRLLEQNLSDFGPYTYGFFPGGAMGYGLLRYYILWVMVCISLRTNSVDSKRYGLYGGMGYEGYGLRGSRLYTLEHKMSQLSFLGTLVTQPTRPNGCCHPQSTINQIAHSSSKACHTAQSREKTISRTPYFGLNFTVKDVIGSVHVATCNGAIFTPWSVVKPYLSLHRKVI